jgi:phage shock protein E
VSGTNWIPWIVLLAGAGLVIWMRSGQVGATEARHFLEQGARVVDVRTPGEFGRDAVPGAVNIPLSVLAEEAPRQFPDRSTVLLLHCLSGGRSQMGCRKLRALGYSRVYNLGSVGRARSLVGN